MFPFSFLQDSTYGNLNDVIESKQKSLPGINIYINVSQKRKKKKTQQNKK